jgi:hypothetical protein
MTKRIPSDNRILAKHAAAIRRLGKRVVADVIEIGRLLTECKRICGHGNGCRGSTASSNGPR